MGVKMSVICTKCKQEVVSDAVFCPWCGKKVTTTKKSRLKARGNGTGTAFKRGSTWTAQVVIGWKVIAEDKPLRAITRSKGGFKTRDDALRYCPILKNGPQKQREAPMLMHYWESYKAGSYAALSKNKQIDYSTAWNKLEKIHRTRIDQLTVSDLQNIVAEKFKTHGTARNCKTILTAMFAIASADGYARADLPSFIQLPKLEETEREPFSETEQAALWKAYEAGDIRAAIPLLMIYTGMMPGEAHNLKVENIDLKARTITGVGIKTKVRKKTPIVLAETILPVVQDLIDHARPDGFIWIRDEKIWYADYYDVLNAAGCRRLTPYSCRHTTATALAITEGIAPQTVRKVMRWSNTRMLDRYAHPDQTDALAAVDSMKTGRQ